MFPLHPPGDPYFINTAIFGIPLVVRWYGVLIVGGAMLAGWIAAGRAERRGYDPEHIWNMLLMAMVCGIASRAGILCHLRMGALRRPALAGDHQSRQRRSWRSMAR